MLKKVFKQYLTTLKVRQAIVKAADDRLGFIYAEKVWDLPNTPDKELENTIIKILKINGISNQNVSQSVKNIKDTTMINTIFAY